MDAKSTKDEHLKRILCSRVHDEKLDAQQRLESLLKYKTVAYPEEFGDCLSRYDQLVYILSEEDVGESTLRFIQELIACPSMDASWRYHLVMGLFVNNYFSICYDTMLQLCKDTSFSDDYRPDLLLILFVTDDYRLQAQELIVTIIRQLNEDKVNGVIHYWYRLIVDTLNGKPIKISTLNTTFSPTLDDAFIDQYLSAYFHNTHLKISWRFQCAQLLLMRHEGNDSAVVTFLLDMIQSNYENESIVGEAYDILIRCHHDSKKWEKELLAYGMRHAQPTAGYGANTQNVHLFADQALHYLDVLCARSKKSVAELELDYGSFESWVYTLMIQYALATETQDKILDTLSFIYNDTSRLSHHKISPRGIVVLIMPHIIHEQQEKLLLEELAEMNGTCTSGHLVRLIGIVATESETPYRISIEDQIKSNFDGRLRARLKSLPTEDYEMILEQVIELAECRQVRYNEILSPLMEAVHAELYDEFVRGQYIEDTAFEALYLDFKKYW